MSDFVVKQGDTLPALPFSFQNADGSPFSLANLVSGTVVIKRHDGVIRTGALIIVGSAASGTARYDWASGDTDIVGLMLVEVRLDFGSGKVITPPNSGYMQIYVNARLQ